MTRNKKTMFLLFLVATFFLFKNEIRSIILDFSNNYNSGLSGFWEFVVNKKEKYITQTKTIEELKKRNSFLENENIKFLLLKDEFKKYENYDKNFSITNSKIISYVKLGDLNNYWISKPNNVELKPQKIYGVVDGNITIGTAKLENANLKFTHNLDSKSVYAVEIGEDKIPGIIFGNDNDMIIKFIPSWLTPKVGDKIYTSGLDEIFYSGFYVGEVQKILKNEKYISIKVKIPKNNYKNKFLKLVITDLIE